MDFEEFKGKFISQLTEIPPTELKENTLFKTIHGWDSMTALMVIDMIDVEYGKTISNEDIKNCKTLLELYQMVDAK